MTTAMLIVTFDVSNAQVAREIERHWNICDEVITTTSKPQELDMDKTSPEDAK
jgi:hypothetical protein